MTAALSSTDLSDLGRLKAALDRAEAAATNARSACDRHAGDTQYRRDRLAVLEKNDADYRAAVALGEQVSPGAVHLERSERDDLVADLAVADRVKRELQKRSIAASEKLAKAEREYAAAEMSAIKRAYVEPARASFMSALNALRDAGVELMAAHKLAFDHGSWSSVTSWYGPAAILLEGMAAHGNFAEHPYSVRPEWLPRHGPRPAFHDLPGVAQAQKRILSEIRGEQA